MSIKETVNDWRFTDVLLADQYASWSYGATKALFDYYEQLSEDIGEDIELDRVAIRCEWYEYKTCLECAREYDNFALCEESDDAEKDAREWLENHTVVLEAKTPDTSDGEFRYITSYVIQQF